MPRLTRGGVYLARLDPAKGAEIGKLRPVAVLTAQDILDVSPALLFICPLSSRSDPAFAALHIALPPRGRLRAQSFALTEHCRAVLARRVLSDKLADLEAGELEEITGRLCRLIGL